MNRKILLIILIILIIGNLGFTYYFGSSFGKSMDDTKNFEDFDSGFVTKVIDGDTVIINGESVRLLGIDANEKGEKCYNEAKKRLEELVLNKEIKLERDNENKDYYKRYLRYLIDNNENKKINVNLELVKEGLAIARFYENEKYKQDILSAEKNARENKIGCKWKNIIG